MRMLCWAVVSSIGLSLAGCGKQDTTAASGNTGSETHWLAFCDTESECGEGKCVCGVCTRSCTSDSDCAELDVDTEVACRATADETGCDMSGAPARVCLAASLEGRNPMDASSDATSPADAALQGNIGGQGNAPDSESTASTPDSSIPEPSDQDADTFATPNADGGFTESGDADIASGAQSAPSYPFPTLAPPSSEFCSTVHGSGAELCQGDASCPVLAAVSVNGVIDGLEAGLDGRSHAVVTSDDGFCLLAAAPGAEPTRSLNPFALPEDPPRTTYPIAVDEDGARHVFADGVDEATHYWDEGNTWNTEALTIPGHSDLIVHGAAISGSELQVLYSAHLPNPGSAYNHTLLLGRSTTAGSWDDELLFEGQDEFRLEDVTFPVGAGAPSAFWFARGRQTATRELFIWGSSSGQALLGEHTEASRTTVRSIGRLATHEPVLTSVEQLPVLGSGPVYLESVRGGQLLPAITAPSTEGRYGGCPVAPGTFAFGSSACGQFVGQACTQITDSVGMALWAQTSDGTAWLAYTTTHREEDLTLADACVEAEIDSGCYCNADPGIPVVSRSQQTLTLARVEATEEGLSVEVALRLVDSPNLRYVDAQGSTLHLAFERQIVLLDSARL